MLNENARHALLLSLLTFAAMLTACATTSPTLPPGVMPPTIPPPPALGEPSPLGAYWTRHCATLQRVQKLVNATRELPAACANPGLKD